MRGNIRLKQESCQAWLACDILEATDRYQQTWNAAQVMAEAKTQVCVEFGEAVQKDFQTPLKRFW